MKCNWEWLSAYLDGLLSEDKRAKLEEHLKTCEACAAKLEEFARVEQAAKKIPVPQLSEAYWENFASRVQNKLAIREKQKTMPAWLEALKSFFQPTTGKLAIAGSVATLLLVAIMGRDYWKKEAYQPPKFEAVAPPANDKVDSVPVPAKDEFVFRTTEAEKDKKVGLVEEKRPDQSVRERGTATLSQKLVENRPAASAPLGRVSDAITERQKSNEEPSLAAFAERDDTVSGDTVVVTAGKKAEIRKEVATSQVKVSAEEIEKLPIRNSKDLLKVQTGVSERDNQIRIREGRQPVQRDTLTVTAWRKAKIRKITTTPLTKAAPQAPSAANSLLTMPDSDTAEVIADIRQWIALREKQLKGDLFKTESEGLYVNLARLYVQLYRFSLDQNDWEKANQRLTDFLKVDLSELARKRLLEIQAELKKLKK